MEECWEAKWEKKFGDEAKKMPKGQHTESYLEQPWQVHGNSEELGQGSNPQGIRDRQYKGKGKGVTDTGCYGDSSNLIGNTNTREDGGSRGTYNYQKQ